MGDRVTANCYTRWIDGAPLSVLHAPSVDLPGALCENVLLPRTALVRAPDTLFFEEVAALPSSALTAWFALVTSGLLRPGQSVLLQGTGGVSLFGLQFARMLGARPIITSRSAEKLDRARVLVAPDPIGPWVVKEGIPE